MATCHAYCAVASLQLVSANVLSITSALFLLVTFFVSLPLKQDGIDRQYGRDRGISLKQAFCCLNATHIYF